MSIDSPSYEGESPVGRRSTSVSERPDYAIEDDGIDIKEDDEDEDYQEDVAEEDEEANADGEAEGEASGNEEKTQPATESFPKIHRLPAQPRRGRPPKRKNMSDNNLTAVEDSRNSSNSSMSGHLKRPHLSFPVDEKGEPLPVINDEYALPDDPEGETKINRDGDLLGGRQFLVRTFTLSSRGERKYMLSTEPARAVGFRDSYLFFQYHPNLYKLIISQEERNDLIDRGVIPYSYRSRTIALVTARAVFKEFGAKIIVDGKNITDDYYVGRLREEGRVIEGTYAREPTNKTMGRGANGLNIPNISVNPAKNAVEFFDRRNHNIAPGSNISSTNWLYQHAAACSRFNSDLFYDRERVLLIEHQGLRDPYTNTLHLPQSTQPTQVLRYIKSSTKLPDKKVIYETVIEDKDLTRRNRGLSKVPVEVFEDVVDDDVKQAILEQQRFEQNP
ncbi:LAQU0S01e11364g1_1 [Lachancea quebecensis]|uniref:LAQU0S01e11364g1_1 n=1 Tax=Lachancea quebecensis TaxID=1654605 RepID=A0A0P1KPU1_9SACH|nr:LAQU0S01e11364g1_1 [Lachancea quebecensis]